MIRRQSPSGSFCRTRLARTPRPNRYARHGRSSGSRVFTPRRLPDPDRVSGMKGANSPITAAGTAPAHPASHTARKIPDSLFVPPSEEGVKPCRLPVYPSLCPRVNSIRILAPQRLHAKNVRMEPGCGHQKKAKFSSFAPALFLHGRRCGNESGIFCRKTSCRGYSMEISGYGSIFFSADNAEQQGAAEAGGSAGASGSGGSSSADQIQSIREKIRQLEARLQSIASSSLPENVKASQMNVLQAQVNDLQQQLNAMAQQAA